MDVNDLHHENRDKRRCGDDQRILLREILFTSPFEMVHAAIEEEDQKHRPRALNANAEKEQCCIQPVQDEASAERTDQECDRDGKEERTNPPEGFSGRTGIVGKRNGRSSHGVLTRRFLHRVVIPSLNRPVKIRWVRY